MPQSRWFNPDNSVKNEKLSTCWKGWSSSVFPISFKNIKETSPWPSKFGSKCLTNCSLRTRLHKAALRISSSKDQGGSYYCINEVLFMFIVTYIKKGWSFDCFDPPLFSQPLIEQSMVSRNRRLRNKWGFCIKIAKITPLLSRKGCNMFTVILSSRYSFIVTFKYFITSILRSVSHLNYFWVPFVQAMPSIEKWYLKASVIHQVVIINANLRETGIFEIYHVTYSVATHLR